MHREIEFWPHLTSDSPAVPGTLRKFPADFRVDEVPAYAPSGEGTHLFVRFEKCDLSTPEAVRRIAQALGVDARSASWAGLKDRRAITTQWASFEGARPEAAQELTIDGVRVLESALHSHKLRTGHLRANRFVIRVRDVPADRIEQVGAILTRIARSGVPNYYGAQRFGRDGANRARAMRWLVDGGRPPRDRFARKWDVSVLQAWVFNRVLADRITDGFFERALGGDLMRKEDSGGLFPVESVEEAQARMDRWEISPTGPMAGPKMRWPEAVAREREEAALAACGMSPEVVRAFGKLGPGARRPLRVPLGDWSASTVREAEEDVLELAFGLPSGAYATVVLDEVFKEGLSVHGVE